VPENIQFSFSCSFFTQINAQFNLECMGPFTHKFSVPYRQPICFTDVRGSVHHSKIHIKNSTRCHSVSKFYFIFIWSSTCFGRETAHHQEPKTALAASGFCIRGGLLAAKLLVADRFQQLHVQQPSTYENQRLIVQF